MTASRAGPMPPAAQISRMIASGSQMVKTVTRGSGRSVRAVTGAA